MLADLQASRHADNRRQREFGEIKPVIAATVAGRRLVAVGSDVFFGKWETFPDFLGAYLKMMLGEEWGNRELEKPEDQRHPVLQWYASLCRSQQRAKLSESVGGRFAMRLDGRLRAYYLLAYDLYVIRHHALLQESLLRRLRHRDQFQGARYELFVLSAMVRAGFDIDFEDETDRSRRHTEFTAKHRSSGQTVSVEAKSRHRRGVLGRSGAPPGTFRADIGRLLREALKKPAVHPFLIFIDVNMPSEAASPLSLIDWRREVEDTILSIDITATSGTGIVVAASKFNIFVVTNTPDHYGEEGGRLPEYSFHLIRANDPLNRLDDQRLLRAIENSLQQAHRIPQEFPRDHLSGVDALRMNRPNWERSGGEEETHQ